MPTALLVLVFDAFGLPGLPLLDRGTPRRLKRLRVRRKALGKNSVDRIGPTVLVTDYLIRDMYHRLALTARALLRVDSIANSGGVNEVRSRICEQSGPGVFSAKGMLNKGMLNNDMRKIKNEERIPICDALYGSCPIDAGGIAAWRGKVHVQICRARIGEEPLNRVFDFRAVDQFMADQHRIGVECAHGQRSLAQLVGDVVDGIESFVAFAHVNGKAHPVGRVGRMVLVIEQDELVTRL